jgi:hypothetical protein
MNVFVTIALVCLSAPVWLWPQKPGLKLKAARACPASRGKMGARHKLAMPLVNVIKPQSQNDTAPNKPILPAFLPGPIALFTPFLNGNAK